MYEVVPLHVCPERALSGALDDVVWLVGRVGILTWARVVVGIALEPLVLRVEDRCRLPAGFVAKNRHGLSLLERGALLRLGVHLDARG